MKVLIILLVACYATAEAPYPASGFRPKGEPFTLPPFKLSQPQFKSTQPVQPQYGAPPVSPQNEYLPPSNNNNNNNNQVASVTPLQNNAEIPVSRPEDQYVPPRPFNENQSVFRPNVLYNTPPSEQLLPQQKQTFFKQNQYTQEYNIPIKSLQQQSQTNLELENKYAPITTENVQESFSELLPNQQREQNNNEGVKNVGGRRLKQRRRKQQRGDQENRTIIEENQRNKPASSYGVPVTTKNYFASTSKSFAEPESTTEPFKRIRTTVAPIEQNTNEAENEDATGPNVSIATAVAGRYYILQPVGELQQLQSTQEQNRNAISQPEQLTQNVMTQNRYPLFTYTFNGPVVELSK